MSDAIEDWRDRLVWKIGDMLAGKVEAPEQVIYAASGEAVAIAEPVIREQLAESKDLSRERDEARAIIRALLRGDVYAWEKARRFVGEGG